MTPSLLYLTEHGDSVLAADAVFDDLQLAFLPAPVKKILGVGATGEEIAARQAIFRLLDDSPDTADFLRRVRASLTCIGHLIRRMESIGSATGEDFVFASLARRTVELAKAFRLLTPKGKTMAAVAEYAGAAFDSVWFRDLKIACAESDSDDETGILWLHMMQLPIRLSARPGIPFEEEWAERTAHLGADAAPEKNRGKRAMPASFPDALAKLYPERYLRAHALREKFAGRFFSEDFDLHVLVPLADEIDFILQIYDFTNTFRSQGYPASLPTLTERREIRFAGLYDVTLSRRGIDGKDVVPNDLTLTVDEGTRDNFFLLTGANGGGKTTFLRAAAVACLLFLNGCPVPCRNGEMGHFSRLHTHFPTDEDYRDTGRYADEVRRAEEITAEAGDHTLAFLNETFSGTDEVKSADASRKLAQTLYDTGTFGVYVTHLHELTGGDIPTLAAVIDESDNNRRTYRIVRMHRTDSSHAADILYRYGLTREQLRGKLAGKEEPK